MTLFKNKYRIESARLQGYDYSLPGEYFVTICAGGMVEYFGDVVNGEMKRNDIGEIAHKIWMEIPNHHEYTMLDEFIIMPNHVHGIIILCEHGHGKDVANKNKLSIVDGRDVACNVSTKISPKRGSLGTVVRSYKSAVSNWCHANGYPDFSWQPRFYDHIIRNDKGLNAIREYIQNNPAQWEFDRNDPSGLYNWKPND